MSKSGLKKCEEALDRLLNHCPVNSQFSAIKANDITPAMVSVAAGFDKGYLKRKRNSSPKDTRVKVQTRSMQDNKNLWKRL